MIKIIPYKPSWPAEFAQIGAALRAALGELALRIDHIGSTSVPNLASKDIIDIQLTVQTFEPFQPVQIALEAIGYTLLVSTTSDHRPPGIESSEADWEKRYFSPPVGQRNTHLHVRATGRANQRYPLLFRDYLRTHPACAAAYEALKYRLVHYHGHSDDHTPYVLIKDPACDIIMSAAYDWAIESSWNLGPSDA